MKQQLFKIRDLRKKDQFKIDDVYLNGYAKILGVYSTAVYNSLCRHAEFNSQKAFPSERLIAEEHGITERCVRNEIKKLKYVNIINIKKERSSNGQWLNNTYFLLDKSEWKKPEELKDPWWNQRNLKSSPEEPDVITRGTESALKDTNKKDTNKKDNKSLVERVNYSKSDVVLTELLYSLVKENYPFLKEKNNVEKDYAEMNRLSRIDGFNYKQIEFIIKWATHDDFWKQNIRSVLKLRKQFESLLIKAKGEYDKNKIAII